ncbi:Fic family protein [Parvibaculum sp.]|uniref:Fic family protein n=1 Tax=Parvibaculum sp. TaxID=2024848 RepID=UPI001B1E31E5|nr:Fic family protein [Parvibaculum sp.]MBO6666457.1 Fic family protein [Parvibaculum sp.]MBO6690948.1 Fic family protein [Parvibaculum sp.]MBO6713078.1 Fic family protein [Parvibaculum sp.]
MTYIHQKGDWPHLIWDGAALASTLAEVRHRQGRLLGRMEALGFDLKQEASLRTLTADVVKSSAIEGEVLEPEEVRSSIARRLGIEVGGLPPASRDVEGIVEVMLDATQRYDAPLTAERLFGWHAALFPTGRSGLNRITVGAWRTEAAGPMQVVSGPFGRERVHFEAPEATRLPREMESFLKWFEQEAKTDPVIKAGVAHFWFVTIHPFEDGNGRIARAIADMALARADQARERFYSMSAQIELERKAYYDQLEGQQRGDTDITPWLDWFLKCLGRAIEQADEMLGSVLYKARVWEQANLKPVNDRQRLVLNRMLDDFRGHMNTSKYAKLAKCSTDTALRDIRDLLDRGLLVQNEGGGRSTSYRLPKEEDLETGKERQTRA